MCRPTKKLKLPPSPHEATSSLSSSFSTLLLSHSLFFRLSRSSLLRYIPTLCVHGSTHLIYNPGNISYLTSLSLCLSLQTPHSSPTTNNLNYSPRSFPLCAPIDYTRATSGPHQVFTTSLHPRTNRGPENREKKKRNLINLPTTDQTGNIAREKRN